MSNRAADEESLPAGRTLTPDELCEQMRADREAMLASHRALSMWTPPAGQNPRPAPLGSLSPRRFSELAAQSA
jgi:hypothetical protein